MLNAGDLLTFSTNVPRVYEGARAPLAAFY